MKKIFKIKKQKNTKTRKKSKWVSVLSFLALIPILTLVILTFKSIVSNGNDDVNSAKVMIKDIKNMRVAIDEFYKETGEFPNLALANDGGIDKVSVDQNGKIVYFKDFLKEEEIPKTPGYAETRSSNKIHSVENFKDIKYNGGWNYNMKTGEIHANLPSNFFEQGVDWASY